jgi:hypothetical protein
MQVFKKKSPPEDNSKIIRSLENSVLRARVQHDYDLKKIAALEEELQQYRNGSTVKYDSGSSIFKMNLFVQAVRKTLAAFDTGKITSDNTLMLFKKYCKDLLDMDWYLSGKAFEEINQDIKRINELIQKMGAKGNGGRR